MSGPEDKTSTSGILTLKPQRLVPGGESSPTISNSEIWRPPLLDLVIQR